LPREPTDIVEPKLRIRESLRAKLEAEAARQQTSLNSEMVRRLEDSFDDKPRANLATAAHDFATSAQDLRHIATRIETEWERLEATRTFLLLADLLTEKILNHNVRDESGGELSAQAWTEFSWDLSVYARELRRLRASVDQQRREEWTSREGRS
jgi:hypothetical protein